MKYSKQCELIKNTVILGENHPTADEVYLELKAENPALSLGTVYRNLGKLSDEGVIVRLHMPEKGDRYDGNCEEHYHAICQQCGEIIDVNQMLILDLDEKVEEATGMKIIGHQLLLNGICANCQN